MSFRPDSPEFEREEIFDEMNSLPQPAPRPAQRCGFAQECIRKFCEENDTLGEGLMLLLENAEEIAETHSVEGYYLAAANQLKELSVCRTKMFNVFNDFVAHHQRNGVMFDEEDRVPQMVVNLRETIRQSENRIQLLQSEMRQTREQLMTERSQIDHRLDNLKRSLEAQYKSRYERKEEDLLRKIRERDEVILTDGIKLSALRGELQDAHRRAKDAKGLVRFLNIKVREITKKARGRGPPDEPKCHVLGTYDDILGTPV